MSEPFLVTRDRFLGGQLELMQPKAGYRAGTDPVLMAAAVPAKPGERFLDLGCGVGTAALCLAHRTGAAGAGLELQDDYAELARQNARNQGLTVDIFTGDVHDIPPELKAQSFHHVMMNPPYYGEMAGTPARNTGRDVALRDRSDLATWLILATKRLRPKGSLTVILRADRLRHVMSGLPDAIGSVRVLPLAAREGRPAKRILIQGRKDGRAPLVLLPPMILHAGQSHNCDGDDFSQAASQVLREGSALTI